MRPTAKAATLLLLATLHVSGWAAGYWVARHLQCCLGAQDLPQKLRQKL